ncbi:sensor histidine kinase [Roseiflexus castenholzii]|uniref:histidine kinase n=1 Tax=Roseiflexus castenholzii (strain DSM 13941 / HLO8) TaxID=383372 RepID=A7NJC7_ROSCS|nr:ATP-binding protein [Roseiflexus castenholzii]ABU57597.1 integral membrane sensor signal transduction histidine kinase [Roseiflexus castenholzii DSM 13941]
MIRRLWVQLALAFALVTTLSVLLTALLANMRAGADFRAFLAQSQAQQLDLLPRLAAYYATHRDWDGVETVFASIRGMGPRGMGPGSPGMLRGPLELVLTDTEGRVIYSSAAGSGTAARLNRDDMRQAMPVIVDGTTVGYLMARLQRDTALSTAAQRFLAELNETLVQAGLLATVFGLILGIVIARSLTTPIDHLARAARRLASGDLTRRAPVAGPVEVASAAEAFNAMAASLEEAEQARRRLLADIAHELRTPLSVIQGNLRALLDDVFPLEKDEIATIYDETLLLSRLVADLRELTLAEAGQLRLDLAPVDVAGVVAQSMALFTAQALEKQVTLHTECEPDLPPVLADADRIAQALNNLLSNALRYTPEGGTVRIIASRARQSVCTVPETDMICIRVIDTGPGIPAADLPRVFDRFWRADRGRARAHGGTGLGLAIARQLVLAHGGAMGVESEPGKGACFWFTLPVTPAPVTFQPRDASYSW